MSQLTTEFPRVNTAKDDYTLFLSLAAQSQAKRLRLGNTLLGQLVNKVRIERVDALTRTDAENTRELVDAGVSNTKLDVLHGGGTRERDAVLDVRDVCAADAVAQLGGAAGDEGGGRGFGVVEADGAAETLVGGLDVGAVGVDPELEGAGVDLGVDGLGRSSNVDCSYIYILAAISRVILGHW